MMQRSVQKWVGAMVAAVVLMMHHTAAADGPVHEVQVVAGRFMFDPPAIQVTAGESVRIVVRSKDMVHGFAIPRLKIDMRLPEGGEPAMVEFVAPAPGRFEIACSEFCGTGHVQMRAALISTAPVTSNP